MLCSLASLGCDHRSTCFTNVHTSGSDTCPEALMGLSAIIFCKFRSRVHHASGSGHVAPVSNDFEGPVFRANWLVDATVQSDTGHMDMMLWCRYENNFEKGVLANTNVGGENCHRGAAIGALLGARNGESGIPAWMKEGLHDSDAIKGEIDAFVSSLQTCHV